MAEGNERSLPSGDSRDAADGAPGPAPVDDHPPGGEDARIPPDDLPGLLALLGRLLEDHAPDEVAVVLREEIERREYTAYANGWRDAAAHFTPALEQARLTPARTLRLVDRIPGQAAVIPFPKGRTPTGAPGDDVGSDPSGPAGPGSPGESPSPPAGEAATGAGDGDAAAASQASSTTGATDATGASEAPRSTPPGFVPKSRRSKVPTIPRLSGLPRPRRDPSANRPPAPGAPDDDVV
ncbi:hypothetical protein [Streptomyces purpureus]|uniref:Uncharacterized protein n=2 Tax=Streptomyces purpureus TaxID=1951 RepID=A0A918H2S2_9ACTN|nr:hypothetical protein [Streptomyces purpureus]GGT32104.1 hypothetical protein GCM10014713_27180 [Streptomyces purpureus]